MCSGLGGKGGVKMSFEGTLRGYWVECSGLMPLFIRVFLGF